MDLVIQAPAISAADVGAIAALAGAQGIHVLQGGLNQAFRLSRAEPNPALNEFCERHAIDMAFVPNNLSRDRVRVVAMDMDSTLITIECVDEIADLCGIKPEVAAITASAMRGEIDFSESLTRRIALLAGLPVSSLEQIYDERLQLSPGAERMLAGFRAVGAKTLLVSGGFTFFTDRLRSRLHLDETIANTFEIADGSLTGRIMPPIVDAAAKAARFSAMCSRYCGDDGMAIAIGDGANDLPMLRAADVSIAYHAKPLVRAEATYAINACGLDAILNLFA